MPVLIGKPENLFCQTPAVHKNNRILILDDFLLRHFGKIARRDINADPAPPKSRDGTSNVPAAGCDMRDLTFGLPEYNDFCLGESTA